MDWMTILYVAFATIGIMEYLKGFFKTAPAWAWRLGMPAVCFIMAAVYAFMPSWVSIGILALSLTQVGYQVIIETVKKKIQGA
jgi:glutaminase